MHAFPRRAGALLLLGGLFGCTEASLSTLPEAAPTTQPFAASIDSSLPSDTVTTECTLVRIEDGTEEGSWESTCTGISGGSTLPPPPPPPLPPVSYPPPPEPVISGGGDGGGYGGGGDDIGPVCAAAVAAYTAAHYNHLQAQETYNAAYDAHVRKYAEYVAWDNHAKSDDVYTLAEQMKLIELGDQLHALAIAMNAAKADYDYANTILIGAAILMTFACAAG